MMRRRTPIAVLLSACLVIAVGLAGCGLGEMPTRPPTASPTLPTTASPGPSSTVVLLPSPPTAARPSPSPLVYLVQPDDNLLSIARRYGTTGRSIAFWNRAAYPSLDPESPAYDPNRIEVGWRLMVIPGVVVDEALESPAAASPTPRPTLSLPPAATPPADGSGLLVSHGPRASNVVALTFDMGGRTEPALAIVHWLVDHDVPATLFSTGSLAQGDATGRAVLTLVAAHPDLFTVGDHTFDHPDLTGMSGQAIADQLIRADTAISGVIGHTTRPLFRPPYGAQNATVRAAAAGAGFPYSVLWDVDTIDWRAEADGGPTTDDIVTKVASRARGGSIVLMHLGGWNTLEALPRVVDGLRAGGLQPVTLGMMLGL
jgi:peptidoglycan/xylan/chitin deacetylase (PgdA/CDA1 family)